MAGRSEEVRAGGGSVKPLTLDDLTLLRRIIGAGQFAALREAMRGEEGAWFRQRLAELAETFRTMPKVYEQDGKGDDAIVYLHLFGGSADAWITERDTTDEQYQAFGLCDLFGDGGELGYISIVELIRAGLELDMHWTPKTLREVKAERATA